MRIGLVSCAKTKLARPAPARQLYASDLFRKALAYSEATYDRTFILSALHHLVPPDNVLAPYDVTLLDMNSTDRALWGSIVRQQLRAFGLAQAEFYVHAGAVYRDAMLLPDWRFTAYYPMRGMAIGSQKSWYLAQTRQQERAREARATLAMLDDIEANSPGGVLGALNRGLFGISA